MSRFPGRLFQWVMLCIARPRFSLLINGIRSPWILASSGLRQGCPLSPYLFILCSELLSKAFKQCGEQLGICIINNAERISHLLYADYILVFAEANRSNAACIMSILNDYCGWTGQCVNTKKLAIPFNKRCPKLKQRRLARLVGYRRVESLDYLGLPLVIRKLNATNFAKVVRSAYNKMNIWGKKHLSYAGRALRICSALLTNPAYLLAHTEVPNSVLNSIEKLGQRFLWQKDSNSKGMHYVGWKDICLPRE